MASYSFRVSGILFVDAVIALVRAVSIGGCANIFRASSTVLAYCHALTDFLYIKDASSNLDRHKLGLTDKQNTDKIMLKITEN